MNIPCGEIMQLQTIAKIYQILHLILTDFIASKRKKSQANKERKTCPIKNWKKKSKKKGIEGYFLSMMDKYLCVYKLITCRNTHVYRYTEQSCF